jgi:tRNA U34 5-carboxymethylaminomethyl modifying GTPase MnmE/TrmE
MSNPSQLGLSNQAGYLAEDTIAAVITALGGPVVLVRMSGPNARAIFHELTKSVSLEQENERKFLLRDLYSRSGKLLDRAGVIFFKGPASYTLLSLICTAHPQ